MNIKILLTEEDIDRLVDKFSEDMTPDKVSQLYVDVIEKVKTDESFNMMDKILFHFGVAYVMGFRLGIEAYNHTVTVAIENGEIEIKGVDDNA